MLVSSIEDVPDGLTGLKDRGFCGRGDRKLFLDLPGVTSSLTSMTCRLLRGSVMKTTFLRNARGSRKK